MPANRLRHLLRTHLTVTPSVILASLCFASVGIAQAVPPPVLSQQASPATPLNDPPSGTASPIPVPAGITATRAELIVPARILVPGAAVPIPWPKAGQARVVVAGVGLLGRSGDLRARPIASVTKVMTALVILGDHPLAGSQSGPLIHVTRAEASSYARRKAAGESLVKVRAGLTLTERQALQGLLIASGNNVADILGRWDAGSTAAFVMKMNATAAELGLSSTHYADTSGLDARSRSNPHDLIELARVAMNDPAFAAIVQTKRASIPLNKLRNTNKLLGVHGVAGIKTGSTRAAGGCLLFAAHQMVDGRVYTVYGAVLGAPGPKILTRALSSSDALVQAAGKALRRATLRPAGTRVASVTRADGSVVDLALARPLTVVGWPGQEYTLSLPGGLTPGEIPLTLSARTTEQTISIPVTSVSS